MQFTDGQRLVMPGQTGYIVDRRVQQTPWHVLYAARKVFFNYRYAEREYYETEPDEWLDVLIRTGPDGWPHESPTALYARKLINYEATEVLPGRQSWFAQPIDWLEVVWDGAKCQVLEQRRAGSGPTHKQAPERGMASLLVMSKPHGQTLRAWRESAAATSVPAFRVAAEILDLLEELHSEGQIIGGISPDDFLIDESGRWTCLASDRVLAADRAAEVRPWFPPQRFAAAYAAPETLDPTGALRRASDLYSWGALCLFLLTGNEPPATLRSVPAGEASFDASTQQQVAAVLAQVAASAPDALTSISSPLERRSPTALAQGWAAAIARCLAAEAQVRPADVEALRAWASKPQGGFSLGRLWRQVVGS
jgi:hypothetical protein